MYSEILYPTDGSEGAQAALEHARDLAETCDARVHVMCVADTSTPGLGIAGDPQKETNPGMAGHPEGGESGMVGERRKELWEEGRQRAEAITRETADAFELVETTTVVKTGAPHEAIIEYAEANSIDSIVMGTHGRTGLDRYLLGSVTEKVVRLSDIPVTTVRKEA